MLLWLLPLASSIAQPVGTRADHDHSQRSANPTSAEAVLLNLRGASIGNVRLHEAPKGVLMVLDAKGLAPGWHGMHFHETGDCSHQFKKAGGHILASVANPDHAHEHPSSAAGNAHLASGLLNEDTNDAGALPNIYVSEEASVTVELFTPFVSLWGRDGRPALLDSDGASLIIHEGPEDQTGASDTVGKRVACAAIGRVLADTQQ